MAKAKASSSKSSKQKSITSFFDTSASKKKKKASKKENEDEDAGSPNDDAQESSDAEMEDVEKAKPGDAASSPKPPPISSIPLMFDDLVSRIPEIKDVADRIAGRPLRVATMCSGTESPLLALDMIRDSMKKLFNVDINVKHEFSCEIEPFKQAYIERNFQPPILFRDVCELGGDEAHTAYGALAPVPGDVDMLVAGTSCVDYSNLNNEKQDIDANGESGRTFRGMMSWVKKHRPPIVILENVCSAPWDKVKDYFRDNDYSAEFVRVDTKAYYIPHTRTRVYLFAVDQVKSKIPEEWLTWVKDKLKRPATATLDSLMLGTDEPRIHTARQKLVSESAHALDRRTGRTDWSRCESRHQRARLEEQLGDKRPLTSWDDGGYCKVAVDAWGDWATIQVERVWDLMDISLLRSAKLGIDPAYKTVVWNLSQNVDRTIGSSKPGICPCLTPSMIPYITNRGGPMVGLEALSMQGLPVDKLLLTRETEDQLADLAGNAMSTTVVGACILAALVSARKLLKKGDDHRSYESKAGISEVDHESMDVDVPSQEQEVIPMEDRICGEEALVEQPLDLSATGSRTLADLLKDADKSARLCFCEGRVGQTTRQLSRCSDCQTSFCRRCGGRPEHNPSSISPERLAPSEFARELKGTLPMAVVLEGVSRELLDGLKKELKLDIPEKRWDKWVSAVVRASEQELRFVEPKRQEIWTAVYSSPVATLELVLHPQQPEWYLYAKAEDDEPADSEIRKILDHAVGRLRCDGHLFNGEWQFALPSTSTFPIKITGTGPLVPSWEARLGLQEEKFKNREVFSQLRIEVPPDDVSCLERNISGTYTLLDKCGTANGGLHRREPTPEDGNQPTVFMLLDPHRTNDAEDSFVFSISMRRYEYGETRPIICKLDSKWRQSSDEGTKQVKCHLPFYWATSKKATLKPAELQGARFAVPNGPLNIPVDADGCQTAIALLVCRVPVGAEAGPEWPRGTWREVDKINERSIFRALSWLMERICHNDESFVSWQSVDAEKLLACERCAPSPPKIVWMTRKNKSVAVENPVQAGEYERRLKRRPSPFVTQLMLDNDGLGTVKVGLNVPTLLHRALSRLPNLTPSDEFTLSWRLDTNFTPAVTLDFPKFTLKSNKPDSKHAQPPSFKLKLRPEQLRSLTWMVAQESKNAPPFIEEEIAEAILDPLGWRAEGRAQRSRHIRGGVLADQVGYGKTAITLGLIDTMAKDVMKEFSKIDTMDGKIPTKATLVVVPPHLTRQWGSEVKKFTGKRFNVQIISTVSNLNSLTIKDIEDADIVIVASNLFKSNVYLENLQELACVAELPSRDGRHFNAGFERCLESLRTQVNTLRDRGSSAVIENMKDAKRRAAEEAAEQLKALQSKRLKGKHYREAAEAAEAERKSKTTPTKPAKKVAVKPAKTKASKVVESDSDAPYIQDTVEVVIPIQNSRKTSPETDGASVPPSSAPPSQSEGSDEESDRPRQRLRRKAAPAVVIVDSESDTDTHKPKAAKKTAKKTAAKSSKTQPTRSRKRPADESSDYEDGSGGDATSSEESAFDANASSEEEASQSKSKSKSKPKPKAVPKPQAKGKGRASASSGPSETEADTDDMDVDDAPAKSTAKAKKPAAKKRKADDEEDRPAKKARRQDTDPWKLGSTVVKKDWEEMRAPPFEMFHFARLVVDEYTYLDGKVHSVVTRLAASRHWVLSGTPPIHDFSAVKTISAFLRLHLGVDDDGEGHSTEVKKRIREQTAVEKFHSFREVRSLEWHAHRHRLGQTFLDQYVRQNIAEIDEIPWSENIQRETQTASEYAIYLELEHYLRALEMAMKKSRKSESDRDKRVTKALGESKTAEEALLKCCSYFDLQTDQENSMKACDVIVKERLTQLDECKAELLEALKEGVKREKKLISEHDIAKESLFHEYIRVTRGEDDAVGDQDARDMIVALLDKAGAHTSTRKGRTDDSDLTEAVKKLAWAHREKTHEIRRLSKELVGRVRSLRYFKVVRDFQKQSESPPDVACPKCGREGLPASEIAVLSSCGHTGCLECVKTCAENEECVYTASGACKSAARVLNIIRADSLGVDDREREGRGKHYGMKLEKIIHKIKKDIPKDERILLFVQFPDLMKKVAEALSDNKIKFLEIKGTAHQKSKNLEKFQEGGEERVLLLNVMDESASGANLTSANHAIFISPLLAPTKEIYQMCETQAVGRLVRFGQTKHVQVYRFLTTHTIDEEIYQQRREVMMRDGKDH